MPSQPPYYPPRAYPFTARLFKYFRLNSILLCIGLTHALVAVAELNIPLALHLKIEQQFGQAASVRITQWQALIQTGQTLSEPQKLAQVNAFFNQTIRFEEDALLWQLQDYWATPLELLSKGAGDCEDYAIAKYFTLKALGVAEEKMRITYVKAIQLHQAHMVLTYFETPRAVPMVLDNLLPTVLPATARKDLVPVYSFNGSGLWLAKVRGAGQHISGSGRLSLWADLNQRILHSGL
jgi:predicted transglutaminase-like cysteine proteinase